MQSGADFEQLRAVEGEADERETSLVQSGCHTVTRPLALDGHFIDAALERTLAQWRDTEDHSALREALVRLLALV